MRRAEKNRIMEGHAKRELSPFLPRSWHDDGGKHRLSGPESVSGAHICVIMQVKRETRMEKAFSGLPEKA